MRHSSRAPSSEAVAPVEVGATVIISGIKAATELNGTIALVVEKAPKSGRWYVKTRSRDSLISLNEGNFTVIKLANAHASGGGGGVEKPHTPKPVLSAASSPSKMPMRCSSCGEQATDPSQCAGCHQDVYCDPSCQATHWIVHKTKCRALRKAAAALSGEGMIDAVNARIDLMKDPTYGIRLKVNQTKQDQERVMQRATELGREHGGDDSVDMWPDVSKRFYDQLQCFYGVGQWFNEDGLLVSSNRGDLDEGDDPEFPCPICFGADNPGDGFSPSMCLQCGQFICYSCHLRCLKGSSSPVQVRFCDVNDLLFSEKTEMSESMSSPKQADSFNVSSECPTCRYKMAYSSTSKDGYTNAKRQQDMLLQLLERRPKGRHASMALWELANTYADANRRWYAAANNDPNSIRTSLNLQSDSGMAEEEMLAHARTGCSKSTSAKDGEASSSTSVMKEVECLHKAAALGLSMAQTDLGNHYLSGTGGLKVDAVKACALYELAAKQGSADAQFCLAGKYMAGTGVARDYQTAFAWYLKAAEQGHAKGQSHLHTMLLQGEGGIAVDYKESFKWAKMAADQGDGIAMANLGAAYFHPERFGGADGCGLEHDPKMAKLWARRAVAGGGDSSATAILILEQLEHRDTDGSRSALQNGLLLDQVMKKGLFLLKDQAFDGDYRAQYQLAQMYGVHDENSPFSRASDNICMVEQANAFGVGHDSKESIRWLKAATKNGYEEAQFQYGMAHLKGWAPYIHEDYKEAMRLFTLAADQGHSHAQEALEMIRGTTMILELPQHLLRHFLQFTTLKGDAIDLAQTILLNIFYYGLSVGGNSIAKAAYAKLSDAEKSMTEAMTPGVTKVMLDALANAETVDSSATAVATTIPDIQTLRQHMFSDDQSLHLSATKHFRRLLSARASARDPPIQEVINCRVVPCLVDFLKLVEMPELQFEAAWTLTNIASGTSDQVKVVIDAGAIPILINLLESSPADDVREQAAWALGNIAGDKPGNRDLVLEAGALSPMLKILNNHKATIAVLRNATWALSNLCRGESPPPDFAVVSKALSTLAMLLNQPDDEVLADACWALSYLTGGTNDKLQAVLEAGVCQQLVELLEHKSLSVITPVLRTIGNIATGNEVQTQVVLDCHVLPKLANLLQHADDAIKKDVCWTISNITAGSQEQIQAVIDGNLIPPIVAMLQCNDVKIQQGAVFVLSNIFVLGGSEQIQQLVVRGCIPPLCKILSVANCKVAQAACDALGNILAIGAAATFAEAVCDPHNGGGADRGDGGFSGDDVGGNPYVVEIRKCGGVAMIMAAAHGSSNKTLSSKADHLMAVYFNQSSAVLE